MRTLTFLALLLVSSAAYAAAPACWPVLPSNDLHTGNLPEGVSTQYKRWAVWRCGPDHIEARAFNLSEVVGFLASADAGTFDKAAADAACATLCSDQPSPAATVAFLRKMAVQKLGMAGKTVSTNAFKRSIGGTAQNPTITYVKVGTVAMDTPCGKPVDGDYGTVPQSAVTPTVRTVPLPLPVYGICG